LTSEEAAAVLAEIAYRLKHHPEQAFRARAYGNAAATLNRLKPDLPALRAAGRLESRGVPVATVAIGEAGATNAGLLAAQILSLGDARLAARVVAWRAAQTESIAEALEDNA